jgi:DNA-binding IclR family transcriptional regulator
MKVFDTDRRASIELRVAVAEQLLAGETDVKPITERIGASPSTVRAFLNRLVDDGHVTKEHRQASWGPVCGIGHDAHNEYAATEAGRDYLRGQIDRWRTARGADMVIGDPLE